MLTPNYKDNVPQTTITGAIDTDDVSITVASATGYPAEPFFLFIGIDADDYEIVLVTDKNGGATWDIVRAQENTAAISHGADTPVRHGVPYTRIQSALGHVPPYIVGQRYTAEGASGAEGYEGTGVLDLSWLPIRGRLVDPDWGVEVTVGGTLGAGAEGHVILLDHHGVVFHSFQPNWTTTGFKDDSTFTGTLESQWILVGTLFLGTWTVGPQIRYHIQPYGGPGGAFNVLESQGFRFLGLSAVPTSVDMTPDDYRGSVPAVYVKPT